MLKIEEGMYVRTKKGIAKIKSLDDLDNVAWTDQKGIFFGIKRPSGMLHFELDDDGYVIGIPSYNIIDLIEAGDYVNGNKVIRIETSSYPEDKNVKIIVCCGDDDYYVYYNEDIKTILIKEQYENNCYRIDE